MGSINSFSRDNFPSDFKYVKLIDKQPYGQAKVYKNIKTGHHISVITVDDHMADINRILKFRNISSYIISLLDWCQEGQELALLSQFKKVSIYYEYCPSSLEMEIQLLKKKGTNFLEEEVWYVLNSIIGLSMDLSVQGRSHMDLRPSNVLVNEFNVVKFAPVGMFPNDINSHQKWVFFQEKTYLAPENLKKDLDKLDWKSNDVFAAGLCILDMMTLDNSFKMYRDQKNIQNILSTRLQSAKYSRGLVDLVQQMLQTKDARILLKTLNFQLKPFQKQIMSLQKFNFDSQITQTMNLSSVRNNSQRSLRYTQQFHNNVKNITITLPTREYTSPNEFQNRIQSSPAIIQGKPLLQRPFTQTPLSFNKSQVIQNIVRPYSPQQHEQQNLTLSKSPLTIRQYNQEMGMAQLQGPASPNKLQISQALIRQYNQQQQQNLQQNRQINQFPYQMRNFSGADSLLNQSTPRKFQTSYHQNQNVQSNLNQHNQQIQQINKSAIRQNINFDNNLIEGRTRVITKSPQPDRFQQQMIRQSSTPHNLNMNGQTFLGTPQKNEFHDQYRNNSPAKLRQDQIIMANNKQFLSSSPYLGYSLYNSQQKTRIVIQNSSARQTFEPEFQRQPM